LKNIGGSIPYNNLLTASKFHPVNPLLKSISRTLFLVGVLAALPASGQTFIDKFVDEAIIDSLNVSTGSVRTEIQTGLTNVLGGERKFSETRIASLAGSTSQNALSHGATIEDGIGFSILNGTHSRNEVVLEYGLSAPVKFDFSSFGAGGYFRLADWYSDQPNVVLGLTLRSNVGNVLQERVQTVTFALPVAAESATTNVDILFSLFDSIDFSKIDDIAVKFTAQSFATDAGASGFLVAIPEPQAYALMLGVMTLGLLHFRRRSAV
jgi:hypothetical protein